MWLWASEPPPPLLPRRVLLGCVLLRSIPLSSSVVRSRHLSLSLSRPAPPPPPPFLAFMPSWEGGREPLLLLLSLLAYMPKEEEEEEEGHLPTFLPKWPVRGRTADYIRCST